MDYLARRHCDGDPDVLAGVAVVTDSLLSIYLVALTTQTCGPPARASLPLREALQAE